MRLVVTGGLGFIGSAFIRFQVAQHPDLEIVNVDNVSCGANFANLPNEMTRNQYQFMKGDIVDHEVVAKSLRAADAVVNFAAESHVDRSISNPSAFFGTNLTGTVTLLEEIRKAKSDIRMVQISTDEVYGDVRTGMSREGDPVHPSSPYAASKVAADLACLAYVKTYGLKIAITRSCNNFGPNQFPEKFIPKVIIRALRGMPIPIYGDGNQQRDWIYVEDNVAAIDSVLTNGIEGQIYNVSAGESHTNLQVATKILSTLRKSHDLLTHARDRPGHDTRYQMDSTKIRRELGWSPKHEYARSLTRTIRWYQNNPWWWEPVATPSVLSESPWE